MDVSVKQKKSKKRKHAPSDTLNTPLVDANASVSEHKQPKKRKRDAQPEDIAASSDVVAHPMSIVEKANAEKKKRKKKKADSNLVGSAPVAQVVDSAEAAPPNEERKEKKKRERGQSDGVKAAAVIPTSVCLYRRLVPHKLAILCPQIVPGIPQDVSSYLASNSISIESPGTPVAPVLSFDQLGISPKLRQALKNFAQPTPIQACAWPALLAGHDVVGIAETGRCVCSCSGCVTLPQSARQWEDIGVLFARTGAHH